MSKPGKKYIETLKKVDRDSRYGVDDAVKLLKELKAAKFDETVEVAVNLGVDPKHSEQMVRGAVLLPNGTGRTVKVAAFVKGEKEKEAKDAGADFVGAEDLVAKVQEGWLGFDKAVATPDMMSVVSKVGKILGTKGMMPNPKVGTVTFEIGRAIGELKKGKVEFKVEKAGIVHAPIGKLSFEAEKLKENLMAFLEAIMRAKPASSKGTYLKKATLSSTMGPGIRLDVNQIQAALK